MYEMSEEQIELKDIKEQTGYLIYSKEVVHKHFKAIQRFLDFVLHHIDTANERAKAEVKDLMKIWIQWKPVLITACMERMFKTK